MKNPSSAMASVARPVALAGPAIRTGRASFCA